MPLDALAVLHRSFAVLRANLAPFLGMAVLAFLPVVVVSLIVGAGNPVRAYGVGEAPDADVAHTSFAGQFVVGMLAFLAHYVLAGALTYGVLEHLGGRRTGVVEGVRLGIARLLPVVDAGFVTGILVGIGFVLFVVPGVILACVLFVAVPTAVVEKPGAFGAMARSADLTRGSRTPIFLVLLATLGLMVLVGVFVPFLLAGAGRTVASLGGALAQVLFGLYGAVCQAVAYQELRAAKEGARPADVLEVLEDPDARS